ncbi:unnamed protein product [Dicrocoelium dendriticum]|nr:unnamed protein product [Dicrocoelium dendriticum]
MPESTSVPTSPQDETTQSSTYSTNMEYDSLVGVSPATSSEDGENRPPTSHILILRFLCPAGFARSDDYMFPCVTTNPLNIHQCIACGSADGGVYSPHCGVSHLSDVAHTELQHPHNPGQPLLFRCSAAAQNGSLLFTIHSSPFTPPGGKHPMHSVENLPIPSSSIAFNRIKTKGPTGASSV